MPEKTAGGGEERRSYGTGVVGEARRRRSAAEVRMTPGVANRRLAVASGRTVFRVPHGINSVLRNTVEVGAAFIMGSKRDRTGGGRSGLESPTPAPSIAFLTSGQRPQCAVQVQIEWQSALPTEVMAVPPPHAQPHRLRVLDTALVPPSPPPDYDSSLPLTFFDVMWLHAPPVENLFLYRLGPHAAAIISNLKSSLSHALGAFYPLAGRLRLAPGTCTSGGRHELHCRPGDAVTFTVAEYDAAADSLAGDGPRQVAELARLVPPLPPGGALLALQATTLLYPPSSPDGDGPARRGLAVGVTVHHAACDGSSSTHFLHTWAAAARACAGADADAPPPPVIDRALVPDPRGLYHAFLQGAPSDDDAEAVPPPGPGPVADDADKLLATFALSKDDLQRVKDVVADEAARRGGVAPPPRCSSLVAALALVWSCYLRAMPAPPSFLLFPVDHRSRTKPPLPATYFGNCLGPALTTAPTIKQQQATGSLLHACAAAVASAIDEAVRGMGTSGMDQWADRVMEALAAGTLSVAGSPRFRVYDLDLGFGRPAKVDVVSVAKTGAVFLAESRSSSAGAAGPGGMEVGISLRPPAMDCFRECFADAIEWLAADARTSGSC